jgi:hypothetical protein
MSEHKPNHKSQPFEEPLPKSGSDPYTEARLAFEATAKTTDKPLFNRTYLKYLGFIVAIAIVILSEKAPTPLDQPQLFENGITNLTVLEVSDLVEHRLLLSFATSPALNQGAIIQRKLRYQALQNVAANRSMIQSVLWTSDRLEVELRWSDSQQLQLLENLEYLVSQSSALISAADRKLLEAEQYLTNKRPDSVLLRQFKNTIAANYPVDEPFQILTHPQSALLITSPQSPSELIANVDQQLANIKYSALRPTELNPWQLFNQVIPAVDNRHHLLIASGLKQATNHTNRLEILSNLILSDLLTANNLDYRLIRQPISNHGYQVVLLSTDQEISTKALIRLAASFSLTAIRYALDKHKKQLLETYSNLLNNQQRLFKLYSKKQFYRLETESRDEYEQQLEAITAQQIFDNLQYFFYQNNSTIRLQPS